MVVLEQFYQIIESESNKVSPLWKAAHIAACVVGAICGLVTAFTFGRILDDFSYNCILNAEVVFDNTTFFNISTEHGEKHIRAIDLTTTIWGPISSCNFAQFTPLVMMISAVIWGVYFGIMARGGAGHTHDLLSRPWTILYPCIFFTSIFFILNVISTVKLKRGAFEFCEQFKPELNNTGCNSDINIYTTQFHEERKNFFYDFYPNLIVAILSSRIGLWSWVFQLVLCLLRVFFVADFDIQLVTVMTKDEEKVEHIVEFAEMEDMEV